MSDSQNHPAEVYAAVRDELIDALRALDDTSATELVPACPIWTVKDLAAHVCGLNAHVLADTPGPLGSNEATAKQVADRATASVGEVLDEWSSMAGAIHQRFVANSDRATALLADLVVHVYDLEEVLHQPTPIAEAATPMSAHRYVPLLQQRAAEDVDTALTIDLSDGVAWIAPQGQGLSSVTLRTSPHNFLRGVTGRLRRADVEAFEWSTDPSQILDHAWNQYGPFRT